MPWHDITESAISDRLGILHRSVFAWQHSTHHDHVSMCPCRPCPARYDSKIQMTNPSLNHNKKRWLVIVIKLKCSLVSYSLKSMQCLANKWCIKRAARIIFDPAWRMTEDISESMIVQSFVALWKLRRYRTSNVSLNTFSLVKSATPDLRIPIQIISLMWHGCWAWGQHAHQSRH